MGDRRALLKIKNYISKRNQGFLLMELLISIAILGIMLAYSFRMTSMAARSSLMVRYETQANTLLNEYCEMIRSRRNEGWGNLKNSDDTGGYLEDGTEDPEYIRQDPPIIYGDEYSFYYDDNSENLFMIPGSSVVDEFGGLDPDGVYTRSIRIYEVYRDPTTHLISDDPLDPVDPETLRVVVQINWSLAGKDYQQTRELYLTNWGGF